MYIVGASELKTVEKNYTKFSLYNSNLLEEIYFNAKDSFSSFIILLFYF